MTIRARLASAAADLIKRWRGYLQRRRSRRAIRRIPGIQDRWKPEWIQAVQEAYLHQEELQSALDDSTSNAIKKVGKRIARTIPGFATAPWPADASAPGNAQAVAPQPEQIAWLLGSSLTQTAKRATGNWLSRHVVDVMMLMCIVALTALPWVARWRASVRTAELATAAAEGRSKPHVEVLRDVSPYAPFRADNLAAKGTTDAKNMAALVATFIGRYPLHAVSAGKPIGAGEVSKLKTTLLRFSLVRITLKTKPAFDTTAFPILVDLVLSTRTVPPAGAVLRAELFGLGSDGLDAIVAIPDTTMSQAAPLLGSADAYLAIPAS